MQVLPKGVRHIPGFLDRQAQERLVEAVRCIVATAPLFVPVMGIFQKARVRHYEQELGRVFVRYSADGEDYEDVVGVVNVARSL